MLKLIWVLILVEALRQLKSRSIPFQSIDVSRFTQRADWRVTRDDIQRRWRPSAAECDRVRPSATERDMRHGPEWLAAAVRVASSCDQRRQSDRGEPRTTQPATPAPPTDGRAAWRSVHRRPSRRVACIFFPVHVPDLGTVADLGQQFMVSLRLG